MKAITAQRDKAATQVVNILNERATGGFQFKASFVANTHMGKSYYVFFDQMFSDEQATDSLSDGYSLDELNDVKALADKVEKNYRNSKYNLAFLEI